MKRAVMLSAAITALVMVIMGCGGDDSIYCVTYETRHTGCGGAGWSEWATEHYEFNLDDYKDGWTPEDVRDKFTGTETECGGACCIEIEYRNTQLSDGGCS